MEAAGKVAIVTGGTSGIGLATARILVQRGARVVVVGRDREKGARAAAELGRHATFTALDVADAREVDDLVAGTLDRWGRLDWAVNAASLVESRPAPTASLDVEDWDRVVGVNLRGTWLCMKHQIAGMLQSGGGALVNVSSINGLSGTPMAAAYCASKHGVIGLTKTAALEYAAMGVRVNVVCPGAHRTPMLEGVFRKMAPEAPEQAEELYRTRIPSRRIAAPEECARAIAWLLSDEASYVTGGVLPVDGGFAAGMA